MNENEKIIFDFESKKETLYKKIISEHGTKKAMLNEIIETLKYKLENPEEGNSISDAIVLVPKIADVVDMMLNNDGTLVKMMEILFKYSATPEKKSTRLAKKIEAEEEEEDDERETARGLSMSSQDDDFRSVSKMLEERYKDDE